MVALETPRTPVAAVTASGGLTAGKHTPVNAAGGPVTVTLPGGSNPGAHLSVEKIDTSGWPVTITGTIRGTASSNLWLSNIGDAVVLVADAAGSWWPTDGGQPYRPTDLLTGFSSTALPNFRKAIAKTRAGTADTKILAVGDSVFGGSQGSLSASNPAAASAPAYLATMMNTQVTTTHGLAYPTAGAGTDTRWTFGASWAKGASGFGFYGTTAQGTGTGNLVFTDTRVTWNRADVYYLSSGSSGNFSVTATGGTAVPVTSAGTAAINKVTASATTAATTNTVTIAWTSGTAYIVAVELWLSTGTRVRVGNAGVNQATALGWSDTTTYGSVSAIKAYAPDLTLINLGINDGVNGYTAASFLTSIQSIVTGARVSGDVIVVTPFAMNPATQATGAGLEPAYLTTLRSGLNVPIADYYTRMGSYAAYSGLGLTADDRHPNDAGSYDLAAFLWKALQLAM